MDTFELDDFSIDIDAIKAEVKLDADNQVKLNIFSSRIASNDVALLDEQLDEIGVMAHANPLVSELQLKYYMVLAGLKAEECVKEFEESAKNNYWQQFWTALAYAKVGDKVQSFQLIDSLDVKSLPTANKTLISSVCAVVLNEKKEVRAYSGKKYDGYTPLLFPLAKALDLALTQKDQCHKSKFDYVFYLVRLLGEPDPNVVQKQRKVEEEAHLRTKITYSIYVSSYFNELLALMCLRTNLGISTSDSRKLLSQLPSLIKTTDSEKKAISLLKNLSEAEMAVKIQAVNALGEDVSSDVEIRIKDTYPSIQDITKVVINRWKENVEKGRYGIFKITGEQIGSFKANSKYNYYEGYRRVCNDNGYGYMNKSGDVVIPKQFDDADDFSEGLAAVKKDDKWGFIDKSGKLVIPCQFDDADDFSEGLAAVRKDHKLGFIDKSGKLVIPYQFDYAVNFHEGLAEVRKDLKYGFIDKSGKLVIPNQFSDAYCFSEGLAAVRKGLKSGFIDKSGKLVIPYQFNYAFAFNQGLAAVDKDDKSGFIDKSGKLVIPYQFYFAFNFHEGLAAVEKDDKWGFIDKSGKLVIPCQFDDNKNFDQGLAAVKKDDKWGLINTNGVMIIPCAYTKLSYRESMIIAEI